jgi:hypothetical protein
VADVITDMDPDAKDVAIEESQQKLKKISAQALKAQQESASEMAAVQQVYANDNQSFSDRFDPYFLTQGSGGLSKFKRTFLNGNFATSQVTSGYKDSESYVIVSIYFYDEGARNYQADDNTKRLDDKYPIVNSHPGHLSIYLGNFRITVYNSTDKKMPPDELGQLLLDVVDLNQLESKLADLNKKPKKRAQ